MVRATVLLPVRNGGRWLEETIKSLENQTFKDFELLVIDDGSTDNSIDIIKQSNLQHIRIIPGPQQGLAKALALGVNEAKTEIIFRQDQDDISLPSRFQLQYNFLEENKDHVAVGSNAIKIDEKGKKKGVIKSPNESKAIEMYFNLSNPLVHSSMAFRKSAVLAAGNYWSPSSDPFPEDFHLWSRLIKNGRISVLSKRLVKYRLSSKGVSRRFYEVLAKEAYFIARQNLENRIIYDLSAKLNRNPLQIYCFRNMKITFLELLSIYKNLYWIKKKFDFKDTELGFSSIVYLRPIWHWVKKGTIKEKGHKNSV
jgi:glycosyltransferase involved in cell wall biosynthesis